ncbi:UDP-glucuronosyltransferase 1A1-like isoform X2 [Branchiostoma floridae]|uniref:UDP-glucuronosyltransferase n=2 Tax=Branchiostoma floridae TaxID=7739 RepID=A0A9J7L7Z7_BRAFL|nr:UDP-glucuronosyltransferase 1A1-like isoform X2 [Branchiostoma floridae]
MGMGPKLLCSAILLVFLGFLIRHRSNAEKVLLVPRPTSDSHWIALAKTGRALVDRGHVVIVIVSEEIEGKRRAEWPDFKFEAFQDQGTRAAIQALQDQAYFVAGKLSLRQVRERLSSLLEELHYCALLLSDSNLVDQLRTSQYSVVISDPFFPCGAILSAHLDSRVPHIAVLRLDPFFLDVKATGVPLPLSYIPFIFSDYTDGMTFLQRLQNVVLSTVAPVIARRNVNMNYNELVRRYIGEEETIQSVTSRTDLWLYRTDNVLDFPRPSMPNMVQVGGLNVRAAVPLTEDIEAFVQSSGDDGVIVVSFGSMVKTMSTERQEVFAAAFARLRQKVVWRYVGEKPAGLGNNTKLLAWLPQNDLLAHPKTRAFITHAGSNGLYEALHHGVPMVCLPLFGDQPANAARVVARGLGVKLDFSTVTSDQLYEAILLVVTNNSYRETAARLSRLHRDQPQSPMERAVWWIEHVIKHGGLPHLRARAVELPWYQYYLLDVAAFLLAGCVAVLGTVWYSCTFFCRKCCTKGGGKLKSQ